MTQLRNQLKYLGGVSSYEITHDLRNGGSNE